MLVAGGTKKGRRKRQGDPPLVDGVYDPTYRSMKTEAYARLGMKRLERVLIDFFDEHWRPYRVHTTRPEEMARKLGWALVRAELVGLVCAGVEEENEGLMAELRARRPPPPGDQPPTTGEPYNPNRWPGRKK